jgi:hypothetical protein
MEVATVEKLVCERIFLAALIARRILETHRATLLKDPRFGASGTGLELVPFVRQDGCGMVCSAKLICDNKECTWAISLKRAEAAWDIETEFSTYDLSNHFQLPSTEDEKRGLDIENIVEVVEEMGRALVALPV